MFNYHKQLENKDLFIQIGTNNGSDIFNKLVSHYKPKRVILIEPNVNLRDEIEFNYKDIRNHTEVIIVSKCIYTDDNVDNVSLFIPAKDGIYGLPGVQPERALGNHLYCTAHFSLIPMNDWGDKKNMIELKAESISFKALCNLYNITNIDYIQIDTEGYDSEIIKSIDFNSININMLRYEKWPFTQNAFTKYHGENSHLYGLNGMNDVAVLLQKNNYTLQNISDTDGEDIIAYKNV
jgi:FkbM family methyltransferase